uniref:Uncharacterized protein n=1 Tax=Plectus sambesii TaxID=2011161 RepID=A0A914VFF5_9BILA
MARRLDWAPPNRSALPEPVRQLTDAPLFARTSSRRPQPLHECASSRSAFDNGDMTMSEVDTTVDGDLDDGDVSDARDAIAPIDTPRPPAIRSRQSDKRDAGGSDRLGGTDDRYGSMGDSDGPIDCVSSSSTVSWSLFVSRRRTKRLRLAGRTRPSAREISPSPPFECTSRCDFVFDHTRLYQSSSLCFLRDNRSRPSPLLGSPFDHTPVVYVDRPRK